jgi:hypothetical protein
MYPVDSSYGSTALSVPSEADVSKLDNPA